MCETNSNIFSLHWLRTRFKAFNVRKIKPKKFIVVVVSYSRKKVCRAFF